MHEARPKKRTAADKVADYSNDAKCKRFFRSKRPSSLEKPFDLRENSRAGESIIKGGTQSRKLPVTPARLMAQERLQSNNYQTRNDFSLRFHTTEAS